MANYDIERINGFLKDKPAEFIRQCEQAYETQLDSAVSGILKHNGRSLVMLAGPSSSGKTTTARLLKEKLIKEGRCASVISLDDFYLVRDIPHTFEDGTVDYERVEALDVPLISSCLSELMTEGESDVPRFCFKNKKRSGFERIKASENEILIIEGLHALNPVITDPLEAYSMTKLYVSVSSRITQGGKMLFTKRDLRFIRRMIRDYHHRNSDVENTFYLWKGVRMGEDRYLFPYSGNADMKIDSIHPYEVSLFKNIATELLDHVARDSQYFKNADELREKLAKATPIDRCLMPDGSLLGEFIQ